MRLNPASTAVSPEAQRDALSAPVADPLWMLARQWQTGGFLADDAGTPVQVRLGQVSAPLHHQGAPVGAIEPLVEAEPAPAVDDLDHGALVVLATELGRRLRDEGVGTARPVLAAAFRFDPAGAGPRVRPFAGRIPDVRGLYPVLVTALGRQGETGTLPPIPRLDPGLVPGVERACRKWLAALAPRVATAASGGPPAPAAWDAERLEYRFRLDANLPAGSLELRADEYDGTGVEWFSFDRTPVVPGPGGPVPGDPVEVHPAPITYPGMPRPRFWELEDGEVNLDALRTDANPAGAVLAMFVHQYANDWFLVPLTVDPGMVTVAGFTVTDTFGAVTEVPAVAAVDGGRGPWRLWDLTCDGPGDDDATAARLLVPPTPRPLEGEPVEDVLLVRDELANLAWLVERVTSDRDGQAVDRYQRYLRLRPPSDPSFDPPRRVQAATYKLGTPLPDYWYPLVAATDPAGRALLALAEVPPGASGVDDHGVQGRTVPHQPGTVVADEEVPGEGAHILRRDRLLAGGDNLVVWRARAKFAGFGNASSGLRFDVLQ